MNSVLLNPDVKINMSLDEIIHLTRGQINTQLHGRFLRGMRNRKKSPQRINDETSSEHSLSFMSTKSGVLNQNPLFGGDEEYQKRLAEVVSNRSLNSNLLQKSERIIPTEHKLPKTSIGVEKVLVPAIAQYRLSHKKLSKPRQLNKTSKNANQNMPGNLLLDKPPPLVAAPIFKPKIGSKVKVDHSDNEILFLSALATNDRFDVFGIESDFKDDILQAKKLCLSAAPSMAQMNVKTLNDRFTNLCRSYQL